jgi:hypothetical protein
MVHAKPLAPGTFHDCTSCGGRMLRGEPGLLDGWATNEGAYFGSIDEFPTQEDADNFLQPDHRPAQRFVKKFCADRCFVDPLKADEIFTIYNVFYCGNCDSKYKEEAVAGACCD